MSSYLDDERQRYEGSDARLTRKLMRIRKEIAKRDAEYVACEVRIAAANAKTAEIDAKLGPMLAANAENEKQVVELRKTIAATRLEIARVNGQTAALQEVTKSHYRYTTQTQDPKVTR